jgi:hypothetical protein
VDYIRNAQSTSVNEDYSIDDYLNTFRSQSSKLLKHEVLDEHTTVCHTVSISMQVIEKNHGKTGQVAISFLRRLVYFDPDGVPVGIFLSFLTEKTWNSQSLFEGGLGLLKSFSLIWIEKEIISVHRLVQHVTHLEIQNMWRPHRYTDQLFEASKLRISEHINDRVTNHHLYQSYFVFKHIFEKELNFHLGDGYPDASTFFHWLSVKDIVFLLEQNEMGKAEYLIKSVITLMKLNTSKQLATTSFLDTLETLLRDMQGLKGNAREAQKLTTQLKNAYDRNMNEWMNIELHLYYWMLTDTIEMKKYPNRWFFRRVLKNLLFWNW